MVLLPAAAHARTDILHEVVPLELAEVLEAPQVAVVRRAALAAHGVAVQLRGHGLGHPLVLELHPPLRKVLPHVAAQLLSAACAPADLACGCKQSCMRMQIALAQS